MASQNKQNKQDTQNQQQGLKKDKINTGEAVPALVEEILGRTGFRGEITQVKCLIKEGKDDITRAIIGFFRVQKIRRYHAVK